MDWNDLLAAFSIYLILEGLVPFLSPTTFKNFLQNMSVMPDSTLRYVGLGSMVAGVVLLSIMNQLIVLRHDALMVNHP